MIVQGAVDAAREGGIPIILVGDQKSIERELGKTGAPSGLIEIQHCTQVAGMDEAPVDVLRRKKDASIRVAFELVKTGQASGVVSAGNSGATLAVGTVVLGRMLGVERPALAGIFPAIKGRTVVIDLGANVDCKPAFLYKFALMAEAYARVVLHVEKPRVGLLSIGEEDSKGNELVRQTHDLLRAGPLNFIGNIEGRDIFSGAADVVVCDGFVGNVVLKVSEGMAETIGIMLKKELLSGWYSRLGAFMSMGAFKRFRKRMDYSEYGGVPLLGLNGVGIISHGRSTPQAIKNAVFTAADMVREDILKKLQQSLNHS